MGRVETECPNGGQEPEPQNTPTLIGFDEWSSLCATGHTPQIMTGIFLRLLAEHFGNPEYIEHPALRDNIFRDNPEDTTAGVAPKGILIEPIWKWNPVDFGTRPAIYIKRNQFTTQRYGINDGLRSGFDRDADGGIVDRGASHTVAIMGSHTCFCIGRTGAETEVLAYEVFRELQQFSPILRRELKLKKLACTQITELSKLEEYDQHFVVGVVVGYAYFETWRLKQIAPWLKSLQIQGITA